MRDDARGELAASIAHEVTAAARGDATCGDAALRWLKTVRWHSDLEVEVGQSINQMISRRAAREPDVDPARYGRWRKKRDPSHAVLDLNAIVRESIELVRRELDAHRVEVDADYASPAPSACADRAQLQQVAINLRDERRAGDVGHHRHGREN